MGSVGRCLFAAAKGLGMEVIGTNSKSSRAQLEFVLTKSHVVRWVELSAKPI
jgi:phosphoglycerate dehydrogenase-like enzyme